MTEQGIGARQMSNNLILTGFSGSGKSQVGLAIAGIQGWDFWDTDEEVVRVSGKSIADIFEEDGEAVFRFWRRRPWPGLAPNPGWWCPRVEGR